ncbi:unnamed protein product [Brassica napus]|nr:unnamed protein product [Brassica napus]
MVEKTFDQLVLNCLHNVHLEVRAQANQRMKSNRFPDPNFSDSRKPHLSLNRQKELD